MFDTVVNQFLSSPSGAGVLSALAGQGLNPAQARATVGAVADGAAQATGGVGDLLKGVGATLGGGAGGAGGLAAGLGGLLGGGASGAAGGGALGAVGGLLGQLTGGGAGTGAASGVGALAGPIAKVVAEKVGIAPQIAEAAVAAVLPKLIEYVSGSSKNAPV